MVIGILKEKEGERRVSALPETVRQIVERNVTVWVEPGAGESAFAADAAYEGSGASLHARSEILREADLLLSIQAPSEEDRRSCKKNAAWLGIYAPLNNPALLQDMCSLGLNVFSMDNVPRVTRAQSMDVLSSQASIAGYKAVLLAANLYPRYFPMLMTAAGSIPPARMLILGAGVAGLQAVATARKLGAVVEVFDTRPAVKEEVMSLGARFIEVEGAADASRAGGYAVEQTEDYRRKQQQKIAESVAKADVVITTAQIPGRPAPLLINDEMLQSMKAGSVIIDIAAATGGNTSATRSGETVVVNGVTIVGDSDLPASMPADASRLYGKNILNFLKLIISNEGQLVLDFDDEIVEGACIVYEGKIANRRTREFLGMKE